MRSIRLFATAILLTLSAASVAHADPVHDPAKPVIEVAFVLDTTGVAEQAGVQELAFVLRAAGGSQETEHNNNEHCQKTLC